MANEITVTASLQFAKGNITALTRSYNGVSVTVTGTAYVQNVQTVGTSEEALLIGDVTPGYVLMKNLDSTNFVSVRHATGGSNCVKLKPGEVSLFRFASAAPFVIADTAPVQLEYYLIAD